MTPVSRSASPHRGARGTGRPTFRLMVRDNVWKRKRALRRDLYLLKALPHWPSGEPEISSHPPYLPQLPAWPTRLHTGPHASFMNAPKTLKQQDSYHVYTLLYHDFADFLQKHSSTYCIPTFTSARLHRAIADFLSSMECSESSRAQKRSKLGWFIKNEFLPGPPTGACISKDGVTSTGAMMACRQGRPSTFVPSLLSPVAIAALLGDPRTAHRSQPPSQKHGLPAPTAEPPHPCFPHRLRLQLALGLRCSEAIRIWPDAIPFPFSQLYLHPSKHDRHRWLTMTQYATSYCQSLNLDDSSLKALHIPKHVSSNTFINQYRDWVASVLGLPAQSIRRSWASLNSTLAVARTLISRYLRHKDTKTLDHYVFAMSLTGVSPEQLSLLKTISAVLI